MCGIVLSGVDSANYLANTTAATTASITAAPLVVSATGINKVYDTTTSASVTLSTTALGSDVVSPSYGSASFATPYVGSNKPVSVAGVSLSGADAGNYSSNTTASTTASITASGGTPNPSLSVASLEVVPTTPIGASNQAPIALQEDMRSGVFSPGIIPGSAYGLSVGALVSNRQGANQSNMLIVANPQRGPEMQSLFPAPVIAPIKPIAPILVPKPSRN